MINRARIGLVGTILTVCLRQPTPVVLVLLASWPAIAQTAKERAVSTLAEAMATVEFVEGVCFLKKRESRIDELTAQADVSKQDIEPKGQYGAIVAGHRERIRSNLASSLRAIGRKAFCEYAWHAFGAYGERFVRRPR
jgi:hypothetical protein